LGYSKVNSLNERSWIKLDILNIFLQEHSSIGMQTYYLICYFLLKISYFGDSFAKEKYNPLSYIEVGLFPPPKKAMGK
jgi:hypothetical protein